MAKMRLSFPASELRGSSPGSPGTTYRTLRGLQVVQRQGGGSPAQSVNSTWIRQGFRLSAIAWAGLSLADRQAWEALAEGLQEKSAKSGVVKTGRELYRGRYQTLRTGRQVSLIAPSSVKGTRLVVGSPLVRWNAGIGFWQVTSTWSGTRNVLGSIVYRIDDSTVAETSEFEEERMRNLVAPGTGRSGHALVTFSPTSFSWTPVQTTIVVGEWCWLEWTIYQENGPISQRAKARILVGTV